MLKRKIPESGKAETASEVIFFKAPMLQRGGSGASYAELDSGFTMSKGIHCMKEGTVASPCADVTDAMICNVLK